MTEKPYRDMSDSELIDAHRAWTDRVAEAAGWPSAYFAATQLEQICRISDSRGLGLSNDYPIKYG